MFGEKRGNYAEIWDDSIYTRFDVRDLNAWLLVDVLALAEQECCKLALKDDGRVISPALEEVVSAINSSRAARLVRDPVLFLTGARS